MGKILRGKNRHTGQGVVEYAGALVIAASIVALALSFVPSEVMAFWGDIIDLVSDYMLGFLPS